MNTIAQGQGPGDFYLPREVPTVFPNTTPFVIKDPVNTDNLLPRIGDFRDVGGLISSLIPYAMVLGGLILFGMLIMGGFEMLTSVGNQEKTAAGAARIKNALIGFVLLFAVFWLAQIIQVLFKIQIL